MRTWAVLALAVALSPVAVWSYTRRRPARPRADRRPARYPAPHPLPDGTTFITTTTTEAPAPTPAEPVHSAAGTTARSTAGGN